MRIQQTFDPPMNNILPPLKTFLKALNILENSENFHIILAIFLKTGNYLSGGTIYKVRVHGFKLDSLSKFKDLKKQQKAIYFTSLYCIFSI